MVATGKPGPIHLTLEPFSPLVRRRPPSHLSRSAVRAAPSAAAGAAEPCANPSAPLRIRCDDEGGAEEGRDQRGGCFLAPPKDLIVGHLNIGSCRYNPTTILTLLQEVSEAAGVRIDWNALVKRTATGITSAREYQMLWRHLAYHHTLLEAIEDGAEPLDDESDLELEIEAVPTVSGEALSEAAACVKVLSSDCLL
ncbi:hypothetical protein GW17_00043238 [Ensete ventricosum]|nr:hypothetical protein GW17_00043238 [Ensete ventricosum]